MPRSSTLKSVAQPREGVHKTTDCLFCDKSNIRADNYPQHFRTHKQGTIETTAEQGEFDVVGTVLVKFVVSGDNQRSFPAGVCYDCGKFLTNPEKMTTTVFDDHICKVKRDAAQQATQEKKALAPEDWEDLLDTLLGGDKVLPATIKAEVGALKKQHLTSQKILIHLFESLVDEVTCSPRVLPCDEFISVLKALPGAEEHFGDCKTTQEFTVKLLKTLRDLKDELASLSRRGRALTKREKEMDTEKDDLEVQLSNVTAELAKVTGHKERLGEDLCAKYEECRQKDRRIAELEAALALALA